MQEKPTKIFGKITKIIFLLITIFLLAYLGYNTYTGIKYRPYKVRVTNVTDSAFTLSWITDQPIEGVVYYGEKDNFLPGPLSWLGKKQAFDDRDISNAQTECVDTFNQKASKTKDKDFVVDISGFNCEDVKVRKLGKYYTHHVTVDDLEPDKEYYFRVGTKTITHSKNKGTYTNNEIPGIEQFSMKTRNVFTEIGTPRPAFGVTYNLYYDEEKDLVKNISFDSLMYLVAKKDNQILDYFSGVANSDGGWSIDMGNIRDKEGNVIKVTDGIELEFIPQAENFLPANRKNVPLSEVEFPLLMVGNNHDTWENPEEEKQSNISSEKSILGVFKHDAFASDNVKDNDTDEMIIGKEARDCLDPDGCVCLFDKQGNNYMIRIDVKMGEQCTPKTVCQAQDKFPGKLDIKMGEMCIDPSGCECFNGSTYANVNAECGCECGGECAEDGGGEDGNTITCWNDKCESNETPVFGNIRECNNSLYPLKEKPANCTEDGTTPPPVEAPDVIPIGVLCQAQGGCTCIAHEGSTVPLGRVAYGARCETQAEEEEYKTLEEVCGKYAKPALVRYTKHDGTGKNTLVCLGNDEYSKYERCKDGTGALTFAHPDFYLIEELGDGKYKLGKKESFLGRLFCPEVYFTIGIEVDRDAKIGPQAQIDQYECCVKSTTEAGALGYTYSFEKKNTCLKKENAELCSIDLKHTFCIGAVDPNLLFAVLYPRSHDHKYNNDKTICEEENGEGLRGATAYSNKTAHFGKNCCKVSTDEYEVAACSGSSNVQWHNCIDHGRIGTVYDQNPIRFNELRQGGGNLFRLPNKFVKSASAQEEPSVLAETDEGVETVFYLPESGMYEIGTFDGETRSVFGDENTSYFYYKNRDGVPGYQAPANPEAPEDNEDLIVPRVVAEISISKTTTAMDIELKEGVNIISFDFLPSGGKDTLEKLSSSEFLKLANLSGYNVSTISYFSGGQWQGGTTYDFNKGQAVGSPFDLMFGKGYVVIALKDITISVPGYKVKESIPIALSSGWNLVGIHGHSKKYTAKSLINSINSTEGLQSDNVTWWPNNKGRYEGYQVSEGRPYGQDFPISPSQGYFVRINDFKPIDSSCKSIIWNPGGQKNGECGTN